MMQKDLDEDTPFDLENSQEIKRLLDGMHQQRPLQPL